MDGPFAGGDRGAPDTQSTEATTAKSTARSRWESSFNGDSTHAIPAPAHSYQNAERTLLFLLLHSNKGTGKSLLMPWKNQERIKARRFVSELFRRFVSSLMRQFVTSPEELLRQAESKLHPSADSDKEPQR